VHDFSNEFCENPILSGMLLLKSTGPKLCQICHRLHSNIDQTAVDMAFFRIFSALTFLILPLFAQADELTQPTGKVILSISGGIAHKNSETAAEFDLEMLRMLPSTTFETKTIWTDGVQRFTGVSLKALADHVGMSGNRLIASAVNDYHVDIPMDDAKDGGPILAYLQNGKEMPLRNKGPLWLVYPFDESPEFRTEIIYSRSIWQLDRIQVVE